MENNNYPLALELIPFCARKRVGVRAQYDTSQFHQALTQSRLNRTKTSCLREYPKIIFTLPLLLRCDFPWECRVAISGNYRFV